MSASAQDLAMNDPQAHKRSLAERIFYPIDEHGIPKIPVAFILIGLIGGGTLFTIYRWYQQEYSFLYGLDYFEPEFQTYWMNLFWGQLAAIIITGLAGVAWVWSTREKDLDSVTPERELGRYYLIFGTLVMASIMRFTSLGLFTEADAAWHQVTIRDTDFTPTHIGLFYFMMPLEVVGIAMAFIWVHTRLPDCKNRISMPFAILAASPFLIMPNLGLNEWGHTFFYAEELFAAPIHWGFVFLGWAFFALAGFILQCLKRVNELTTVIKDKHEPAPA